MFGRIRSLVVKELYAVLLDPKTRFQVFVGPFIMLDYGDRKSVV